MQQPRGDEPDTWIAGSRIATLRNNTDAVGLQGSGILSRDGGFSSTRPVREVPESHDTGNNTIRIFTNERARYGWRIGWHELECARRSHRYPRARPSDKLRKRLILASRLLTRSRRLGKVGICQ